MNEVNSKPRRPSRNNIGLILGLTLAGFAVAGLAVAGTGIALAGGKGCEGFGERHHPAAWMRDGQISTERLNEMKQRLLERAERRLELSAEQRQQAEAILNVALPQVESGLQRMAQARETLRATDVQQSQVEQAAAELGNAIADLAVLRHRVTGELRGTLNADQQEQLDDMLEHRGGWGRHRG